MGRRVIPVTQDAISRAVRGVERAGIKVRTVCVRSNGDVVINGDVGEQSGLIESASLDGPKLVRL